MQMFRKNISDAGCFFARHMFGSVITDATLEIFTTTRKDDTHKNILATVTKLDKQRRQPIYTFPTITNGSMEEHIFQKTKGCM